MPKLTTMLAGAVALLFAALTAWAVVLMFSGEGPGSNADRFEPRMRDEKMVVSWWGGPPDDLVAMSYHEDGHSNINKADYAGAESCRNCHKQNYEAWSKHPHRWMNAEASEDTVQGDFSGQETVSYRGGYARFFRDGDEFHMELERDGLRREYLVTQTIGSRFYQYYVGKALQAPERPDHEIYTTDHVLPFGYWLDRREWVPTVHVHSVPLRNGYVDEEDFPSEKRPDPFAAPGADFVVTPYTRCNGCHTTLPAGDLLVRNGGTLGLHAPLQIHVSLDDYLAEAHPDLWDGSRDASELTDAEYAALHRDISAFEAPEHAVQLGIGCEACHLGSAAHARDPKIPPDFLPRSPHLHHLTKNHATPEFHRTQANVNWVCSRCHSGGRRQLAGGMATWNSTEFSDAMRGSCYSQLKCTDCHNPHQATGTRWQVPPERTDQLCLKCHEQYQSPAALRSHTHHAPSTAHCMDCHMPRVTEGMQDIVRTHMIYSPTQAAMIEANQVNACNLCHIDETVDWTVSRLQNWYGVEYSQDALQKSIPDREEPAGLNWLQSPDQSVRLLAMDALARSNSRWALGAMLEQLDDPYLMNRQFARTGLEQMLNVRLADHGYRYFMESDERQEPIRRIRAALLQSTDTSPASDDPVQPTDSVNPPDPGSHSDTRDSSNSGTQADQQGTGGTANPTDSGKAVD